MATLEAIDDAMQHLTEDMSKISIEGAPPKNEHSGPTLANEPSLMNSGIFSPTAMSSEVDIDRGSRGAAAAPAATADIWLHILKMEVEACNSIIQRSRAALQSMVRAFEGLEPLTTNQNQLLAYVYRGEVPREWSRWSLNLQQSTLGSWVSSLESRVLFLSNWIGETRERGGDARAALPLVPLGTLFRPRAFLQAVLREFARSDGVQIYDLDLSCELMQPEAGTPERPPLTGCYLTGLFLRAATWDPVGRCLVEGDPEIVFSR